MPTRLRLSPVLVLLVASVATTAHAQLDLDSPAIDYFGAALSDPVTRLNERLASGDLKLAHDERFGYLPAVLQALEVSPESQTLVFSKTSFQLRRIGPSTPRAVYFGDNAYVGWVQDGDVVEVSSVDPRQGAVFFTLSQKPTESPRFDRQTHECLSCHTSALTKSVPGHLVRSVYPDASGQPVLRAGTHLTDHSSPLRERWGGWYVSGWHGSARHLGNAILRDSDQPEDLDVEPGANTTDLSKHFATEPYLRPTSDIVALLVLEHQTQAQNYITRASYLTRAALHDDEVLRKMLEEPEGRPLSPSTKRRLQNAAEPLVRYLLFCDEAELEAPVRGNSRFREEFEARGPRAPDGRSLRDLDLGTRLFKYPLSFTVYSPAFEALPLEIREIVFRRLGAILRGADDDEAFEHLSRADRRAILEILRATLRPVPAELIVEPVSAAD